jgi:hypothetical protein
MAEDTEPKELTEEELAAELKARAIADAEAEVAQRLRVENMVGAMAAVLSQFEAGNSEALGAAYTFAHRLTTTAINLDPKVAPVIREMALRLVMNTADPKPADANIQGLSVEEVKDDQEATPQ